MMTDSRLVLWLGVSVGVVGAELSWRALAPIAAGPRSEKPPVQLVVALGALFGSAVVIFAVSHLPGFSDISRSTWEDGLLAWVASPVWVAAKNFEAILSGAAQKWVGHFERLLNVALSAMVIVGFFDTARMLAVSGSTAIWIVLAFNSAAFVAIIVRWRVPAVAGPVS